MKTIILPHPATLSRLVLARSIEEDLQFLNDALWDASHEEDRREYVQRHSVLTSFLKLFSELKIDVDIEVENSDLEPLILAVEKYVLNLREILQNVKIKYCYQNQLRASLELLEKLKQ